MGFQCRRYPESAEDGQALPLCSCPVSSSLGRLILQAKAAAKALKVQKAKAKEQERNKAEAKLKEKGAADSNKSKVKKEADAKKVNVQPQPTQDCAVGLLKTLQLINRHFSQRQRDFQSLRLRT